MHCDVSRISAGVQFKSFAAAGTDDAKHFPNLPVTCPKSPRSFQIPPPTFLKPFHPPPKATENPSKRLLEAHLGLKKSQKHLKSIPRAPQELPRAPPRGPTPSQTPPKLSPRVSQTQFLCDFFARFFQVQILTNLSLISCRILHVFSKADLQNSCAHAVLC